MRPYFLTDLEKMFLERAMRAHRQQATDPKEKRAVDPVRSIPAPKKSQRQFACRLCGYVWPPWRGRMPLLTREGRAEHRCWVPQHIHTLRARIEAERDLGPSELAAVLNDQFEEMTGHRT